MTDRAVDPIILRLVRGEEIPLYLTPGAARRAAKRMECSEVEIEAKIQENPLAQSIALLTECMGADDREKHADTLEDEVLLNDCLVAVSKLMQEHGYLKADPQKPVPQVTKQSRKAKPNGTGLKSGASPASTSA